MEVITMEVLVARHEALFLMVILEGQGWDLMGVLDLGSKEGQVFLEVVGEEEDHPCRETMNQEFPGRMKVLQERKIWNRKVVGKVLVIIKWEEIQWQEIIGIKTFLLLGTDSLAGEDPGQVCQVVRILVLIPYLLS